MMEGSSETGLVEVSYALDELPASVVRRSKAKVASSVKRKNVSEDYAIGIDLGTTYSCVGVFRNGHVTIIANKNGNRITNSYVAFTDTEKIVGDSAKMQASSNPKNTVYDAKRMIGRKFNDPIFKDKLSIWPFEVFNQRKKPRIRVNYKGDIKIVSPEEISASILMELRECANAYLDGNVTKAIITVPAYFNDSQRQATIDAGKIAGFDMIKLINEPTAAAIAHGFGKGKSEKNILVYDLGGGTFDVAILTTKGNKFDVRAVCGDTDLGGRDIDNLLVDYVVSHMKRKKDVDLSTNSRAMAILQQHCEIVKQNLSFLPTQKIQIEKIIRNIDVNLEITRGRFEDLCDDLFENTLGPVEKALSASKLSKEDIHEVVLVGGSTRIPKVQSILKEFFDGKTLNKSLNPDEAVACGAAIMAAGMNLEGCLVEVSDVIPLALGINVKGELMDKIIESNSKIPICREEIFSTVYDNQTSVTLTIQEGEDKHSGRTRVLGEFVLDNIELARAGEPIISVTFEVDVNGILNVSAEDVSTKSSKKIAITGFKGRLSEREIDRMRLVEIGDSY